MKIIIAAGGTGGHIYPGIAIAEEIRKRDPQNKILFIGAEEGMEGKIVRKESFEIKLIKARGLLRKISWKAISAPFMALFGFFQSLMILKNFKPDWTVSCGGYVSLPVVAASKILGIPIILHEQNVLPGITNRFAAKFSKIITYSFPGTNKYLNGVLTGNPVRKKILEKNRIKCKEFVILILGGSQGSRNINFAVLKMAEDLRGKNVKIIHITGERDYQSLPKTKIPFYTAIPYMYNIEEGLRLADLAVSRAGATALSEIFSCGIPSILIPFPFSAEGHQDLNAAYAREQGAALVLPDQEIEKLSGLVSGLIGDKEKLSKMREAALLLARPDAAAKFADLLYAKN